MSGKPTWPKSCTLMGCRLPKEPGHHHHFYRGHLDVYACRCPRTDQPGTRPGDRSENGALQQFVESMPKGVTLRQSSDQPNGRSER